MAPAPIQRSAYDGKSCRPEVRQLQPSDGALPRSRFTTSASGVELAASALAPASDVLLAASACAPESVPTVPESMPASMPMHRLTVHVCPLPHVPQVTEPPHPSEAVPQLSPAGHVVIGVQPQTLGAPPPPQVSGEVQAGPQVTVPPHPLGMVPQLCMPCTDPVLDGARGVTQARERGRSVSA